MLRTLSGVDCVLELLRVEHAIEREDPRRVGPDRCRVDEAPIDAGDDGRLTIDAGDRVAQQAAPFVLETESESDDTLRATHDVASRTHVPAAVRDPGCV